MLSTEHVPIPVFSLSSPGLTGRNSLPTLMYCGSTTSPPRPRSRGSWRVFTARSGRPSSSPTSKPFSSIGQWKMCFWMSSTPTSHFTAHNTTPVADSTLCNIVYIATSFYASFLFFLCDFQTKASILRSSSSFIHIMRSLSHSNHYNAVYIHNSASVTASCKPAQK